jgi:hypothetical protein
MTKQQHVAKAVLQHGWTNLGDWVNALDDLADLTDDQIDQVAERARRKTAPCAPESPGQ